MRQVKSFKFADFPQLYKGTVSPLLKLNTFQCSSLCPLDCLSIQDKPQNSIVEILHCIKYTCQVFDRLVEILQKKANGFEVSNEFRFSDVNNLFVGEFEAGLCTALIGQLIFSLFFTTS